MKREHHSPDDDPIDREVNQRLEIAKPAVRAELSYRRASSPPPDAVVSKRRNVALHHLGVKPSVIASADGPALNRFQRAGRAASARSAPHCTAPTILRSSAAPFVPAPPGGRQPVLQRLVGETQQGVPIVAVPHCDVQSHLKALGSRRRSRASRFLRNTGTISTPLGHGLYVSGGDVFGSTLSLSPSPFRRLPVFQRIAPSLPSEPAAREPTSLDAFDSDAPPSDDGSLALCYDFGDSTIDQFLLGIAKQPDVPHTIINDFLANISSNGTNSGRSPCSASLPPTPSCTGEAEAAAILVHRAYGHEELCLVPTGLRRPLFSGSSWVVILLCVGLGFVFPAQPLQPVFNDTPLSVQDLHRPLTVQSIGECPIADEAALYVSAGAPFEVSDDMHELCATMDGGKCCYLV